MKIKTAELTGAALDWAVAKAHYTDGRLVDLTEGKTGVRVARDPRYDGSEHSHWFTFFPSTYWSQGGPIIEREEIAIVPMAQGWEAQYEPSDSTETHLAYGPTPLIAAMRCFVASKLGDEVEVPDELL
jgi:hypothetical protein